MNPLQEGIYYKSGETPGKYFTIIFLEASQSIDAPSALSFLKELWKVYNDLKVGKLNDLSDSVPNGNLTVLFGYGPNAFKISGTSNMPNGLKPSNRFSSPRTSGGGALLPNAGLHYRNDINKNTATEPLAIQLIGDTELSVHRGVIETWKLIYDLESNGDISPFSIADTYSGFQRDDRRSWIDFHDGLSNLRSGIEREQVLRIKDGEYAGGSYLCFMRIHIDLTIWRNLSDQEQEKLVGRDKQSGCPFFDIDSLGSPLVVPNCPFMGTSQVTEQGNEAFIEPPFVGNPELRRSHVQRANLQHNQSFSDPQSLRIYRQGYEFYERTNSHPRFSVGLNFVSFQDTPARIIRLLTRNDWFGLTNFGGLENGNEGSTDSLLSLEAAGIFLVPPVVPGSSFPGSEILGE